MTTLPQVGSRETAHGYWDVTVEVESTFVAVNGFVEATTEENGELPAKKRARKSTGKKRTPNSSTDVEEGINP